MSVLYGFYYVLIVRFSLVTIDYNFPWGEAFLNDMCKQIRVSIIIKQAKLQCRFSNIQDTMFQVE